jgi:hypothetical protein
MCLLRVLEISSIINGAEGSIGTSALLLPGHTSLAYEQNRGAAQSNSA